MIYDFDAEKTELKEMFANIYLNEIDQYVKNGLHCKYYFRYLDDSIAMFLTKKEVKGALENIST